MPLIPRVFCWSDWTVSSAVGYVNYNGKCVAPLSYSSCLFIYERVRVFCFAKISKQICWRKSSFNVLQGLTHVSKHLTVKTFYPLRRNYVSKTYVYT